MKRRELGWWAIVAALLLASGAMLWHVRQATPTSASSRAIAHAAGRESGAQASRSPSAGADGTADPRGPALNGLREGMGVGQPLVPAAASRPLQPDEFDVCGVGIVRGESTPSEVQGEPPSVSPPPGLQERWTQEVDAMLPALAKSRAPGAEAAVALMQGRVADLVRFALRDHDPRAVQWALAACRQSAEPMCRMLSPRLWIELEPDNGNAWLALMEAEPAAQADALYGLSRASRFDERDGSVVAAIDAALPAGLPVQQRIHVLVRALGVDMAHSMPTFSPALRACSQAAVSDLNRRAQCDALAQLLANRSGTLLSHMVGARLGEWVGWPAERIEALRLQIEQAQKNLNEQVDAGLKLPALSCAQFEQFSRHMSERGSVSEWLLATRPAPPR